MELEPEDMTPDMIATIIFSEEKGILLDSSPDHTVQHLFPDKSRKKSSSANKDELGFIYQVRIFIPVKNILKKYLGIF